MTLFQISLISWFLKTQDLFINLLFFFKKPLEQNYPNFFFTKLHFFSLHIIDPKFEHFSLFKKTYKNSSFNSQVSENSHGMIVSYLERQNFSNFLLVKTYCIWEYRATKEKRNVFRTFPALYNYNSMYKISFHFDFILHYLKSSWSWWALAKGLWHFLPWDRSQSY